MKPGLQACDDAHALKCELAGEVLRSSGTLRLQVTGWSMLPSILPGDMLTILRVSGDDIAEGDIVLFGRDRRLFVHRVVTKGQAQSEAKVLTRGDAMPQSDSPVSDHELLGKVCFIERNGRCTEPRKTLRLPERAVAAMIRRSDVAARLVVGVHNMLQVSQGETSQHHNLRPIEPVLDRTRY